MATLEHLLSLSSSQKILGKNYCHLGKRCGKHIWNGKYFLKYDLKTDHWELKKFNWLLLILRKIGFYKSTHLKNILIGIKKVKDTTSFHDEDLTNVLTALWKKTYGKDKNAKNIKEQTPPLISQSTNVDSNTETHKEKHTIVIGNVPLSEAEIICFAETHTDRNMRKKIGKTIEDLYQEKDTILCEGFPHTQSISHYECSPLEYLKNVHSQIEIGNVHGIEPENFNKEIEQKIFLKSKEMEKFLSDTLKDASMVFKSGISLDQNIKALKEKFSGLFKKEFKEIISYYSLDETMYEEKLKYVKTKIKGIINALQQPTNLEKIDNDVIHLLLIKTFSWTHETAINRSYHHLTKEERELIQNTFIERNEQWKASINTHYKPNQRLFLVGGWRHFFNDNKDEQEHNKSRKDLIATLLQDNRKLVIVISHADWEKIHRYNNDIPQLAVRR